MNKYIFKNFVKDNYFIKIRSEQFHESLYFHFYLNMVKYTQLKL